MTAQGIALGMQNAPGNQNALMNQNDANPRSLERA
jgi:hypothetical protein